MCVDRGEERNDAALARAADDKVPVEVFGRPRHRVPRVAHDVVEADDASGAWAVAVTDRVHADDLGAVAGEFVEAFA